MSTQAMVWHPTEKRMVPRPKEFRGDASFDTEMDLPAYSDPKMQAQLARLEDNKLTSSPAVNVEFALEQYERNLVLSRGQTWAGQSRWQGRENEEMRLVRIMSPTKFMRRLQRVGVDARPEYSRHARLWLNDFSRVGRVGVNGWVIEDGVRCQRPLTTLQYPYGPEYSIMRFNQYNVPTQEKYRGWRTVLLELIRTKVITEREALDAFGPAVGPAADFYLRHLQGYRRQAMGLTQ